MVQTVALGYSKFCELFTEEEWDGFDYSLDLYFWCARLLHRVHAYVLTGLSGTTPGPDTLWPVP